MVRTDCEVFVLGRGVRRVGVRNAVVRAEARSRSRCACGCRRMTKPFDLQRPQSQTTEAPTSHSPVAFDDCLIIIRCLKYTGSPSLDTMGGLGEDAEERGGD